MELGDNLSNERQKIIERANASYASKRAVTGKDYIEGKSYLGWDFVFKSRDRWYKVFAAISKVDHFTDLNARVSGSLDVLESEFPVTGCEHYSPVFVDKIQFVEIDDCAVPSRIRFQITDDLHCFRPRFFGAVLDPLFEVSTIGAGREAGVVSGLAVGDCTGRDKVIKRSSEIVHSVTNDHRNDGWRRLSERDVKPMLTGFEITFTANSVGIMTQILKDQVVKLGNVRLRPLELQKCA